MKPVLFAKKVRRKLEAVSAQFIRSSINLINSPSIVLMYHRVTNIDKDPYQLAVKPDLFYQQIEHLKKHYSILFPNELAEFVLKKKKFPKNCVTITFDDGYADNYLEALPILETFDAPALFYVCTGFLNSDQEKWDEQITQIFLDENNLPAKLEINFKKNIEVFDTSSLETKTKTCNQIYKKLLDICPLERNKIISEMFDWAALKNKARPQNRAMTNEELKKLSKSKFAVIGAHTNSHAKLSSLNFDDQFSEIEQSKKILEKIIDKKIKHFAYPFGTKKDYDKNTLLVLKQLGFELACSLYYGQIHSWTNRFEIPRMLTNNWTEKEFAQKLVQYFK